MCSKVEVERLLATLDSLGFFQYTLPSKKVIAWQKALDTGDLYSEETNRTYFLDAEELTECGSLGFLGTISPFLQRLGVPITSRHEEVCQGRWYSITLNGVYFRIWSETEVGGDLWQLATARTLVAVNTLLRAAGSEERLYYDAATNDTRVVFLTEKLYRVISRHPDVQIRNFLRRPEEVTQSGLP
jgi:hypothetical protein